MVTYNINDKKISFKQTKFDGKKSIEFYEKQIYSTLSKIGLTKEFIEIQYNTKEEENVYAQALWNINNQEFVFRCESQPTSTLNLGAISQAIQEDIRQVTRGIKDLFMIMNQYKVSNSEYKKKTNLLSFSEEIKNDESKSDQGFKISELSLIKLQEGEQLSPEYHYLREVSNDRLEILYLNLKEECLKQNKQNHPLLRALTIMRRDRGLKT